MRRIKTKLVEVSNPLLELKAGELDQLYGKNFEQGYNYFHYGAIPQTYENPLHSIKLIYGFSIRVLRTRRFR